MEELLLFLCFCRAICSRHAAIYFKYLSRNRWREYSLPISRPTIWLSSRSWVQSDRGDQHFIRCARMATQSFRVRYADTLLYTCFVALKCLIEYYAIWQRCYSFRGYINLNRMGRNTEHWWGKYLEGRGIDLNLCTITILVWRQWGKYDSLSHTGGSPG
jgi:hypothetical protein